MKVREAEAITSLKELRQQVRDLEEHWQVSRAGEWWNGVSLAGVTCWGPTGLW